MCTSCIFSNWTILKIPFSYSHGRILFEYLNLFSGINYNTLSTIRKILEMFPFHTPRAGTKDEQLFYLRSLNTNIQPIMACSIFRPCKQTIWLLQFIIHIYKFTSVISSVQHGSVLSAIHFLIFINDLAIPDILLLFISDIATTINFHKLK